MKKVILFALTICFFANVYAQKTKTSTNKLVEKTFIVSEATAKDLPEGVSFSNNKILIKPGFKFESIIDGGAVNVVNAKGVITGTFKCACGVLLDPIGKCSITNGGGTIQCSGKSCCAMQTTINPSRVSDMQMKQN